LLRLPSTGRRRYTKHYSRPSKRRSAPYAPLITPKRTDQQPAASRAAVRPAILRTRRWPGPRCRSSRRFDIAKQPHPSPYDRATVQRVAAGCLAHRDHPAVEQAILVLDEHLVDGLTDAEVVGVVEHEVGGRREQW